MSFSVDSNNYNRLSNLDNIEFRIIDFLAKSDSKYADYLFKLLKYDTEDCLSKPSLSYGEKMALLYVDNGDASKNRLFLTPYIDDAIEDQASQLHVYIESVIPQNHLISTVNIAFETLVHNKVANIYGDANMYNEQTNPSELDGGGNPIIIYKSRESVLLKSVIAALNGAFIAGVGTLQFNKKIAESESRSKMSLWNSKKFFGHKTILTTMISGVSQNEGWGF